jgi:hypothetical protein
LQIKPIWAALEAMDPEQIEREIEAFAARMSEHVDSIRIFVTYPEAGMTAAQSAGRGNWFAQRESCREWLSRNDQSDLANMIGDAVAKDEDEESC